MNSTEPLPSAEAILETEKKLRPLTLDPIVVASLADFHKHLKEVVTYCSCKAERDTSQSKPPNGLGGSGTGIVSPS